MVQFNVVIGRRNFRQLNSDINFIVIFCVFQPDNYPSHSLVHLTPCQWNDCAIRRYESIVCF
ncbi:MAG: hypothetical protein II576_10100 [Prevotella sp.]|nr:hypothetical protein [Prevotella sp.]